MLELLQAVYIL